MIRPFLTEAALFLTPFAVYALFLWATRAKVLTFESWPGRIVGLLMIAAFALVILSLVLLAQFSGTAPGGAYQPAHIENGHLVPGAVK